MEMPPSRQTDKNCQQQTKNVSKTRRIPKIYCNENVTEKQKNTTTLRKAL